jgi:hypothetical protein
LPEPQSPAQLPGRGASARRSKEQVDRLRGPKFTRRCVRLAIVRQADEDQGTVCPHALNRVFIPPG